MMQERLVAHAVVGWNQIEYLTNAIDSVLNHRSEDDDLFVYITGGALSDHKEIEKRYDNSLRIFLRFVDHDNSESKKVGSLYRAYNQLMDECKAAGYKYLNLMQSDFQLLWWDTEILEHYLEVFQHFQNALQINTGFVRQGSHPDVFRKRFHYSVLSSGGRVPYVSTQAIGDWGFLDLERAFKSGLTWSGNESFMASRLAHEGLVLPFSRIPCVAPIPWPAVIRNGEEIGMQIKRSEKLLLRPKKDDALSLLKRLVDGPLWQEEWITSWGWWSMQPTWATEFTTEYFQIQSKNTKNTKLFGINWSKYGCADTLLPPPWVQQRPTYLLLCKVLIRFAYYWLKNLARQIINRHIN